MKFKQFTDRQVKLQLFSDDHHGELQQRVSDFMSGSSRSYVDSQLAAIWSPENEKEYLSLALWYTEEDMDKPQEHPYTSDFIVGKVLECVVQSGHAYGYEVRTGLDFIEFDVDWTECSKRKYRVNKNSQQVQIFGRNNKWQDMSNDH